MTDTPLATVRQGQPLPTDRIPLLPFSELSTPPGRRKENMYHPGQTITVQVLQVDAKRKRISLGAEGSKIEGSTADYRAYLKKQQRESGLNAIAAAFEKLKQP